MVYTCGILSTKFYTIIQLYTKFKRGIESLETCKTSLYDT